MIKKRLFSYLLIACLILPGLSSAREDQTCFFQSEEEFTDRDQRDTYDERDCVKILLNGNSASCTGSGVSISGSTVTITKKGTYLISGQLNDGMIIVDAEDSHKVQLVLDNVSVSSQTNAPLYIRQADKVFLTLAPDSQNTLAGGSTFRALDGNNIDAVIFSKDDLTLNGSGSLQILSPGGHGIVSKDDLVITGGHYQISSSGHGFSSKDSLRISAGQFSLETGKHALHASHDEDSEKGYCFITGGTFSINAQGDGAHASGKIQIDGGSFQIATQDDGVHTDSALLIRGGNIQIINSYEGLEGQSILITGGEISLKATDDGLNAAGGNDQSGMQGRFGRDMFAVDEKAHITIAGGKLRIDAQGDGIDSNGNFIVTGGETYVSGPSGGMNGALDFNGSGVISGGIFLAAGTSSMAQSFDASSTQGVILASVSGSIALEPFSLKNALGETLISWQSQKNFNLLVISCPGIVLNET